MSYQGGNLFAAVKNAPSCTKFGNGYGYDIYEGCTKTCVTQSLHMVLRTQQRSYGQAL